MIDLRSDTLTVPTKEMREYIAKAPVGDDVFSEDPSANELQEYVADLLGKESALFVPSGTMGNQISLAVLTNPGDEVIVEADSHIFYYETAAPSIIARVQLRCIPSEFGIMEIDSIENAIRSTEYYFPKTSLICIENTHNRHGGTIVPLDYIKKVNQIVEHHGLKYHCDGARLWNACAETGVSPKEYADMFDTISVCFSKGLGAPVGSVIASTKENIQLARKWRKILGGGMRQAGIIASAGLYALKNNMKLLPETHENAKTFAGILNESEYIDVNLALVHTNIVMFKYPSNLNAEQIFQECKKKGVLIIPVVNNTVRAVFHFQISHGRAIESANIIKDTIYHLIK